MTESIKFSEYQYLMGRIAKWLIDNKAFFKKRDVYNNFKQSIKLADLENIIKQGKTTGKEGLVCEYVECAIQDNSKSLGFLPNYVTRKTGDLIYKNEYVDMANRVNAYEITHCKSPAIVYRTTQPAGDTWTQFTNTFGKVGTIDEALGKVKGKGYKMYYNSEYSNQKAIERIKKGLGINCTDSSQVFYRIGQHLGYSVQFVHVQCKSGGHVRLRLKHSKHTGGKWINRDPAAVLNGNSVTSIWCADGTVKAYDPAWIFTDLEK